MAIQQQWMTIENGFGYVETTVPWVELGGAPWINGTDPTTDGYYWGGNVYAQERNGNILFEAANIVKLTPIGNSFSSVPFTGEILVYYPVLIASSYST